MNDSNYVGYILLLTWTGRHGQHGQPVQDLGCGQGVRPLPHDLDEVAGIKIWTELWVYCYRTFYGKIVL